jgi:hypothetical protein
MANRMTSQKSSGSTEMSAVFQPKDVQLIRLTSKNMKTDTTMNPVKIKMYSVYLYIMYVDFKTSILYTTLKIINNLFILSLLCILLTLNP